MKKFLSLLLSLSLLPLVPTALAADVTSAGGTGSTSVDVSQEASTFSVSVPTSLPVNVAADGTVTVATNSSIVNNSCGPIEVKSATVNALNGWTLVDYATDFSNKKVGLKEFGFQLNGRDVAADGTVDVSSSPARVPSLITSKKVSRV